MVTFHQRYTDGQTDGRTDDMRSQDRDGLTENAGVENVAPSSGAYSEFQVRVREVRASEDGSPPVKSKSKIPVGSLRTAPRSSSRLCMKA